MTRWHSSLPAPRARRRGCGSGACLWLDGLLRAPLHARPLIAHLVSDALLCMQAFVALSRRVAAHVFVTVPAPPPLPTILVRQVEKTSSAAQEESSFLAEHMQVCACNTCWAAGTWARRLLLLCLLPAAAGAALACINDMGRLHARTRHPCAQRRFTG